MTQDLPPWLLPWCLEAAGQDGRPIDVWMETARGTELSPEVTADARRLLREILDRERLSQEQAYLEAVEAYLEAVVGGGPLRATPIRPQPPCAAPPSDEEALLPLLAAAHAGDGERMTRLNLSTRRSAIHYRNFELGHDNQVLTFHIGALRAQATGKPHADV